jgi:integrase
MRWSEIADDLWTIPSARTKNAREQTVPLSAATLALLPTRGDRPFLFGSGPRGFSNWSQAKEKLDGRLTIAPWRLHDLRRTAATGMADRLGVLPHVVEALLNHIPSGVAATYNRAKYLTEVREALWRWSDHLAAITIP